MAKLLSYFNLCPIMDPKDFLGVAEDKEEGTIINTLGKNIIIIIKLNSQKQMKSWTTIDKLNTKVVYDKDSDRYVGGFGNNYLKCWNDCTEDLKKVKRTKVAKPIQDILTVKGTTVIVFTDGSCSALDTILSNVKSPSNYTWPGPITQKGAKILKVESHEDETGETFLTILVADEKEEQSLFHYKVPNADEEAIVAPSIGVIRLKRDNAKLLNSCIVQGNKGLVILSIWSDKRMMRQDIREDTSGDVGQFLEMINFVKLDESFSIASPAKNYVAIYGGNVQQDGSSLMLYNIQYNLIEAKQHFKVLFNNSRLWTLGTNILLATGQSLSVIPFYIAEEQLLHIIGSKRDAHDHPPVQNDMIDEDSDALNLIEFKESMPLTTFNIPPRERPITEEEFDEMVETLVSTHTVNVYERKVPKGEAAPRCTLVINEDPEEGLSMPLELLAKAMEHQGYSEMEITNELVPQLIIHGATPDLMRVLRKYTTLSESVLVDCTHNAIRTDNKALLARCLTIDFEEEYMVYSLRKKLAIEDVIYLVQFLYECLSGKCACPEIHDMDLCEVVLKWLASVVDAHYTNILMSKSKRMAKLFAKWRDLIEKHIESLQQLSSFSPLIERMALAKETKVATSSKWYNIEVIRI